MKDLDSSCGLTHGLSDNVNNMVSGLMTDRPFIELYGAQLLKWLEKPEGTSIPVYPTDDARLSRSMT